MLRLIPYDSAWPAQFDAAARLLRTVLGDSVAAIEHVGSTAVPGLAGKPVIDIAIAVTSESAADACRAPLAGLGYAYRGPNGPDPLRRYFTLDVDGVRMQQIHLYIVPAPAWDEKLLFRDALRNDPTLAAAYTSEKYRIAAAIGWDKSAYAVAKDPFVAQAIESLRRRQPPMPIGPDS